jgi:glutamate carboxypeptidase
MRALLPSIVSDIRQVVECESPSADLAAVARSADVVARVGTARLGVEPDLVVREGRTHLVWRVGKGTTRVLLLGHHDTVWPIGSLSGHPFAVQDGVLRGPGCFDMKAGVVMAIHAVAALRDVDGVTLVITGDEELGSPTSRDLVEQEAAAARAVLVLEPSADGGALKTERKGIALYEARVTGRAAHAGLDPENGVNATLELAHQVLRLSMFADLELGTTVTPTVLRAGTTTNTVPGQGVVSIDVRVRTVQEERRVDTAVHALRPVLDGAALEVTGGPNRPPLEAAASAALFQRARTVAATLGLPPLTCAAVGGGSDGNFAAAVGTPTLDGLGAVGGGAHADDEHVLIDGLAPRTALVAALVADLLARPPERP